MNVANVNDTAFEIIKATSKGERELYYPDPWFIPVIYDIYPSLFEFDFICTYCKNYSCRLVIVKILDEKPRKSSTSHSLSSN